MTGVLRDATALDRDRLQELADALVWSHPEGHEVGDSTWRHNVALTDGWNNAMRLVAGELGVEITTKGYRDRVRYVEAPAGHETFTFAGEKMGTLTCKCGKTFRCMQRNAADTHRKHRQVLAWAVIDEERRVGHRLDAVGQAAP